MNIAWKYLDKRRGAAQAVRDYQIMKRNIENTPDDIKAKYTRMVGVGSPNVDGMPHAHDPKAGEARIVNGIEEIDVLKERYRQALEYMDWYLPAWNCLSDDEQYVLRMFYRDDCSVELAVEEISERYHIERASAYRRKNRALEKLANLLFGKK